MGDQNSIIAVVTGASRGLGRGIARALGSKGATVYVTGRAAEGALEEAAREVTEQGGKGIAIACDHRNDDQVKSLFERVNADARSEEHTSELQSLMRISYAVFCLKKQKRNR